jgi:hypothetical protein
MCGAPSPDVSNTLEPTCVKPTRLFSIQSIYDSHVANALTLHLCITLHEEGLARVPLQPPVLHEYPLTLVPPPLHLHAATA